MGGVSEFIMNILFTNIWMSDNTGDSAIWKSMMRHLREAFPKCEFVLSCQAILPWDMEQLKEYNPKTIGVDWSNHLEDIDIVISQGGGYMMGDGSARHLNQFRKAQALGKPTFFATQTFVGPVNDNTKRLLNEALNTAHLVVAREKESKDLLVDAGVCMVKVLPDQVFTVKPKKYNKQLPENAIKIGIRSYAASEKTLQEIALFADMVVEAIAPVVLVPVGHGGDRDDRIGARRISELMKHKSIVIEDKVSAEELMDIVKDGIFISDRYHGIVYAASMGTPFIALTPDIGFKMPGILKLYNYPIPVLDIKTIKAKELFKHVVEIHKNEVNYRELLNGRNLDIKDMAEELYSDIIEGIKLWN